MINSYTTITNQFVVHTEVSWRSVTQALRDEITEANQNEVADALDDLISISSFVDVLNPKAQERMLQVAGLTGWKDRVLKAIDE